MVGCWHGYLSGVSCRLSYVPADAIDTVSCFSKIQIGFTFLVPAYLGSPRKMAVKWMCVCAPGQLSSLTPPKSGPVRHGCWGDGRP